MEEAGLEFRSTKDLDIVLYVEAMGSGFWEGLLVIHRSGRIRNP